MNIPIKLTQMTKGSGCGCKIAPALLHDILSNVSVAVPNKKLIAGFETKDDAAVYELDADHYIISTVDFFTPVVDDAFQFGRIAAANAISDVYAMGGNPILAISILGFPSEKLEKSVVTQILEGGKSICEEAGITIAGGHTIENPEPFFGLSVTGIVKARNLKRNVGAKCGDKIYITKPLGIGILNTAIKRDIAQPEHIVSHIENMSNLNTAGRMLGEKLYVHAMTDITGFGILGHLIEMLDDHQISAMINFKDIPIYSFIDEYLKQNCLPDNTYRNWNSYESKVEGISSMKAFQILNDPQTNGGLMLAIAETSTSDFETDMIANGFYFKEIGAFVEKRDKYITIVE